MSEKKTPDPVTIAGLKISNLACFEEIEVEPGQITVLTGPNGSGKSSMLELIAAGLAPRGGLDTDMIRTGADRGCVTVELSDGKTVRKARKRGAGQTVSVRDGEAVYKSGSKILAALADAVCFDPTAWLKKDRTKALLESFPLRITKAEVAKLCGDMSAPTVIDYDRHAILVLADVDSVLMSTRRTTKSDAKALAGVIAAAEQQERIEDPADELAAAMANAAEIQAELDRAEHHERVLDAASADASASADAVTDAERWAVEAEERAAEAQTRVADFKRDLALAVERNAQCEARAAELPRPVDTADAQGLLAGVETTIATLTEARGAYHQQLQEMGRVDADRGSLAAMETTIDAATAALDRVRAKPGELLAAADLPIKGLAYKDGQLTLDSNPVSKLSDAETICLAAQIAVHRVREQKGQFILVDRSEALDGNSLAAFLEVVRESSPIQWFCAGLGEQGRDWGPGAQVVKLGGEA